MSSSPPDISSLSLQRLHDPYDYDGTSPSRQPFHPFASQHSAYALKGKPVCTPLHSLHLPSSLLFFCSSGSTQVLPTFVPSLHKTILIFHPPAVPRPWAISLPLLYHPSLLPKVWKTRSFPPLSLSKIYHSMSSVKLFLN